MKVSVIIPAYNAEKTIGECLESLLRQDYENYEVIVVDDGSEDNTKGVVESYADEKLVYVRQPNGGPSAARNAGISRARGEYVIFCDADDCVSAHYVRTPADNAHGDSLVVCVLTTARELLDTEDTRTPSAEFDYLRSPENFAALLDKCYVQGPCCKLFKKSVIERRGLQFDRNMCFVEDTKFVYEYLYVVRKINYINRILYFYNTKNSSLTTSIDAWKTDSFLTFLDFLSDSFEKGRLEGTPVINYYQKNEIAIYYTRALLAYTQLPYRQARMLQTKMLAHPLLRSSIDNCAWETLNDYPGMGLKMRFFVTQNSGLIWALAGFLKRWKERIAKWTRKKRSR